MFHSRFGKLTHTHTLHVSPTLPHPRELSFKKGDIIDLTHSVDDNWLEGGVDGRKGIFPKAYVRVGISYRSDSCTEVCRLVVQCNRQMGVDSSNSVNC